MDNCDTVYGAVDVLFVSWTSKQIVSLCQTADVDTVLIKPSNPGAKWNMRL